MIAESLIRAHGAHDPYPVRGMLQDREREAIDALSERVNNILESSPDAENDPAMAPRVEAMMGEMYAIALRAWLREMKLPLGTSLAIEQDGEFHGISLLDVGAVSDQSQSTFWALYGLRCHKDGSVETREGTCIVLAGATLFRRHLDGSWVQVPAWGHRSKLNRCGTRADGHCGTANS